MKVLVRHMVLIMFVWLMLVGVCLGKQVYLKDGGIIESQSAWKQGDKVFVKVNRDIIADFNLEEIDLGRTFPKAKPVRHTRRKIAAHKASAPSSAIAVSAAAAANATNTKPAALPAQVAPATAVAQPPKSAAQPAPAVPAPVAIQSPEPVAAPITPAVFESSADKTELMKKALEMQKLGMSPQGGGTMIILSLVILAISLLIIVAHWIIFKKAGEAGWKSLVPLYNMYILMQIAGKPGWWMFLLFVPLVGFVVFFIAMLSLAKKFSRSELFGAGIFLLPVIFLPVLAFGGSEYEG